MPGALQIWLDGLAELVEGAENDTGVNDVGAAALARE
jgi:hypothetical protein